MKSTKEEDLRLGARDRSAPFVCCLGITALAGYRPFARSLLYGSRRNVPSRRSGVLEA